MIVNHDFIVSVVTAREVIVFTEIGHAMVTHFVLIRVNSDRRLADFHALAPRVILLSLWSFALFLRDIVHDLLPTHAHFMILIDLRPSLAATATINEIVTLLLGNRSRQDGFWNLGLMFQLLLSCGQFRR